MDSIIGEKQILVNGRFARQRLTGVQRYASEITKYLADKIRVLIPPENPWFSRGPVWEQLILPRTVDNKLLWSPTNTGPLAISNQVVTIHDLSVFDHPEWFTPQFSSWYRFLLPKLSKRVKIIITDSRYSKSRISSILNISESKIIVINPGVSEKFAPTGLKERVNIIEKYDITHPYILNVGSIEPRKNLLRLIQAWERAFITTNDFNLVIIGVKGYPFSDAKIDKLPDNTRILDNVEDNDLPAFYSEALAFIYPSLYEGFGLPPLEAMACGTPVIASNTTSLPEVVGDAGLLINPYNVDEIAQAIEIIVEDNTLREALREKGLERAKLFSWDITAQRVWDVLCQVQEQILSQG